MNASISAFLCQKILFILRYPTKMAHLLFNEDLVILNMLKA